MSRPRRRKIVSPRKTQRRWHLAPVITHGSESLEAGSVLDELASAAGVLCWQAVRDVSLWAETPVEERSGLFTSRAAERRRAALGASEADVALRAPLEALTELIADPGGCDPQSVQRACERISRWAADSELTATALGFAQAAALAVPENAPAALRVAELASGHGENARAETWYRRTVTVGRRSGDWESYSAALLELGRLYRERGTPRVAQRFLIRSLRAATRRGLRTIRGAVLHELFGVAVDRGRHEAAETYARALFELEGPDAPGLPRLAHELAGVWIEQGAYAKALPTLEALLALGKGPAERVLILADLARAAGGAHERAIFERAWSGAWQLLAREEAEPSSADALLALAQAAAALPDAERAENAAVLSAQLAAKRGDPALHAAASAMLRNLRNGLRAHAPLPPPRTSSAARRSFADELAATLRNRAANA